MCLVRIVLRFLSTLRFERETERLFSGHANRDATGFIALPLVEVSGYFVHLDESVFHRQ